jgi:hypothetical protein
MLILNIFIYKSFCENKYIYIYSRYHCCSNVSNSEDSNAFSVNLLYIFVNLFYRCVNLGKSLRMKFIYFHLDKVWKR